MQVQLIAIEAAAPEAALRQAGVGGDIALSALSAAHSNPHTHTKPNFSALSGPIAITRSVLRTHGFRGLWLGQTGTLIRESGGAVAWFGTKEAICSLLLRRRQRNSPFSSTGVPLTTKDLFAWESALAGAAREGCR